MIEIIKASEKNIADIESILLEAEMWLESIGKPLWEREWLTWDSLSKEFEIGDFYIALTDGAPAGCMAVIDHDPEIWPDIKKGASLFIHRLAVKRAAAKKGIPDALIHHAKKMCAERGIDTLRLDCHGLMPRLRAVYERNGFKCVGEGKIFKIYDIAYYEYKI